MRYSEAIAMQKQALNSAKNFADAFPENMTREFLGECHNNYGTLHLRILMTSRKPIPGLPPKKIIEAVKREYHSAEVIFESLHQQDKYETDYRVQLSRIHDKQGVFYFQIRDFPLAETHFKKASEFADGLIQDEPENASFLLGKAMTEGNRGGFLAETGKTDRASEAFKTIR